MHQQIKLVLSSPSSTNDGSGAMAIVPVEIDPFEVREGALLGLLELLADERYNLRMAGGAGIETGGEFTFAVDDDRDGDVDEHRAQQCAAMLREKGYKRVRVVEPYMCEVDDRVGALRDCLKELRSAGRQIDEIFVGTPREGKVPIQVTTVVTVGSGQSR
ncbi:MAG TPA: hypothetical protein VKA85_12135 [Candidatus Limnocylindrales bacterium]|nr:hypothetical protein [Candidatus Limnocylindrales bacterium]